MGFARRFHVGDGEYYIKLRHRLYDDFHVIGEVMEVNDELNIAKIQFTDRSGKLKKYWFHLFTGNVVSVPRKHGEFARDVDQRSEKANFLSIEPVYPYDLDPKMDINYKRSEYGIEEEDEESNPNESISKLE